MIETISPFDRLVAASRAWELAKGRGDVRLCQIARLCYRQALIDLRDERIRHSEELLARVARECRERVR